jgi:hypothetical protein
MTHTTIILSAVVAAGAGLMALGGLVYTRIHGYRRALRRKKPERIEAPRAEPSGEPGVEFPLARHQPPLARYDPMFRLLTGADADFLLRNRHCPKVGRQWERSQRRVVRLYLRELAADFQSLHREARALVALSPQQHPRLLAFLFKQQFAFWRTLVWIEVRLSLGGSGMPRVNPEALAGAFEALRREISAGAALAQDRLA